MAKLSPVNAERLDVAHAAVERLLRGLKSESMSLTGKELQRMQMVEQAVTMLECARLK